MSVHAAPRRRVGRWLATIAPGVLVAATGVGAGDLATAAFTGSELGVAILWAVVVGAALKFVLNEGLARWQLATGDTLLEGCVLRFGWPAQALFLAYLLLWSFFVASTLMSACGVVAAAIAPAFGPLGIGPFDLSGKIVFGAAHSVVGAALVFFGGYRLFERVMGLCIGLMFATVVFAAVALRPDWSAVARGLVWPVIPDHGGQGVRWTVILMGGVGGTVTVLSYGYWIREEGRAGVEALRTCRVDLGVGYAMTALFGAAMVIIGSASDVKGDGSNLIVAMADKLANDVSPVARWAFLIGGWSAVFSSLLGVWQGIPYLFADFMALLTRGGRHGSSARELTRSGFYRLYLAALATLPMVGLFYSFKRVQMVYAIVGAAFMPLLAVALLLLLSTRIGGVEARFRNRPATTVALALTLVFFAVYGWLEVVGN